MKAQTLIDEHRAIMSLISQLVDVAATPGATPGQAVSALRWQINRMLMTHIAQEDRLVYPTLLASEDAGTRAMVREMMDELGGIAAAWQDYLNAWPPRTIDSDPAGFIAATRAIERAFNARIAREEHDLFPRITGRERLRTAH